jgi:hypothetical protein
MRFPGGSKVLAVATVAGALSPLVSAPLATPSARLLGVHQIRVGYRDQTAWETIKGTLEGFSRAYVDRDVTGAMRWIGRNFTQDAGVLRNALLRDFQRETSITLDLVLQGYRTTRDGAAVQLDWNRTGTDQRTGQSLVRRGSSRVLFDRHDAYRIVTWFGTTPFGLGDPQWETQSRLGDPGLAGSFLQSQAFAALDADNLDWESVVLDLESPGGSARRIRGNAVCPGCAADPEDLVVGFRDVGGNLFVIFTSTDQPVVDPAGDNAVPPGAVRCPGASSLEEIGSVAPASLQVFDNSFNFPGFFPVGSGVVVFGVQTAEGNFGVLEVQVTGAGGVLVNAVLRWKSFGPDPGGGTPGEQGC